MPKRNGKRGYGPKSAPIPAKKQKKSKKAAGGAAGGQIPSLQTGSRYDVLAGLGSDTGSENSDGEVESLGGASGPETPQEPQPGPSGYQRPEARTPLMRHNSRAAALMSHGHNGGEAAAPNAFSDHDVPPKMNLKELLNAEAANDPARMDGPCIIAAPGYRGASRESLKHHLEVMTRRRDLKIQREKELRQMLSDRRTPEAKACALRKELMEEVAPALDELREEVKSLQWLQRNWTKIIRDQTVAHLCTVFDDEVTFLLVVLLNLRGVGTAKRVKCSHRNNLQENNLFSPLNFSHKKITCFRH